MQCFRTVGLFLDADAKGPAVFHNNLVSNPGRGVIWINEVLNLIEVRNNHILVPHALAKSGNPENRRP